MKSNAPRRMASTAVAMLAYAVNITTAGAGRSRTMRLSTSSPSSAPSFKSKNATSNPSSSAAFIALAALGASTATWPADSTAIRVVLRIEGSSSTISTRMVSSEGV